MTPKAGRVVIASGASESSALKLVSETIVGIYMPASWTAADLSFRASQDGVSFSDVFEFGALLSVQAGAAQYVPLDLSKFVGVAHLKVKSQLNGSAVNQAAERVLTPVFRAIE
jgi:hypothetical protein